MANPDPAERGAQFKARLRSGERLVGTLVTLPSPEVAEVLALAGVDWLWVDLEHGPLDMAGASRVLQAVAGRCACLVRPPANDVAWIKRVLDIGCDGVVIPLVNSPEEALAAVAACQYPPRGVRSVGIARANDFALRLQEEIEHAHERLTIVLQAEHIDAVRSIERIVQVPGVDAILVGPYDLSGSMGLTGQVTHPEVQAAVDHVCSVCRAAGMPLGIFAGEPGLARAYAAAGFGLIGLATDAVHLWRSVRQATTEARGD